MEITKGQIEAVKRAHDLRETMAAHGIVLKRQGQRYVGRCPFHQDRRPSLSVDPVKGLWHCFGCQLGGDVLTFLSKIEGKSYPTLLRELSNGNGAAPTPPVTVSSAPAPSAPEPLTPKLLKLLARVVEFYQGTLARDPRGVEYLKRRGITDPQSLADFGVGVVNGSLLDALPPEGEVLDELRALGLVTARGREFFADCIVIPLKDLTGAITGCYGRRITDEEPHHLYLPGPRRGLVNWQAAKRSPTILLTEAILDALTLYDQGFKNVIPCYGTSGLSEEHLACFERFVVKEILLCFDSDEAGKTAAAHAANRLLALSISCSILTLPDKDVNDYFQRHTPEEFEALVRQAHPLTPVRSEALAARAETLFESTEAGFRVGYGERRYEVKGLHRLGAQLRVTLFVTRGAALASGAPVYLDAVDLVGPGPRALRSRRRVAPQGARGADPGRSPEADRAAGTLGRGRADGALLDHQSRDRGCRDEIPHKPHAHHRAAE